MTDSATERTVAVKVVPTYQLIAHNRCVWRGCHYPEDEWTLDVTGTSIEELIEKAGVEFANTKIVVDGWELYMVERLEVDGQMWRRVVEDSQPIHNQYPDIIQRIEKSDAYLKRKAELAAAQELEKEQQQTTAANQQREQELQILANLKAKYPEA